MTELAGIVFTNTQSDLANEYDAQFPVEPLTRKPRYVETDFALKANRPLVLTASLIGFGVGAQIALTTDSHRLLPDIVLLLASSLVFGFLIPVTLLGLLQAIRTSAFEHRMWNSGWTQYEAEVADWYLLNRSTL